MAGECVEVTFTLVKVPVMFRSWKVPAGVPTSPVLVVMFTLLRFTFRMQDSGTPTISLVEVAPVAVKSDTVML